ncbi:MAG: hypothetical protein FJW29_07800 [Acidobacteria bacterium]|nr:hypothetical protein [Acidobacteriota bacterium]
MLTSRQMMAVCASIATARCSADVTVTASATGWTPQTTTAASGLALANTALGSMRLLTTARGGKDSVAIIDSGIAPTQPLASRIIEFVDFTRGAAIRTTADALFGNQAVTGCAATVIGGVQYRWASIIL